MWTLPPDGIPPHRRTRPHWSRYLPAQKEVLRRLRSPFNMFQFLPQDGDVADFCGTAHLWRSSAIGPTAISRGSRIAADIGCTAVASDFPCIRLGLTGSRTLTVKATRTPSSVKWRVTRIGILANRSLMPPCLQSKNTLRFAGVKPMSHRRQVQPNTIPFDSLL
jgi:hypothetical protein